MIEDGVQDCPQPSAPLGRWWRYGDLRVDLGEVVGHIVSAREVGFTSQLQLQLVFRGGATLEVGTSVEIVRSFVDALDVWIERSWAGWIPPPAPRSSEDRDG